MGALLSFVGASPARIQATVVALLAATTLLLATAAWGLWERGRALKAEGERDLALAQVQVVSNAARACSAGVDQAKRAGDAAVKAAGELVAAAKRLTLPARVERTTIEHWLEKPTPSGKDCRDAWGEIEQLHQKARAPQ